MSQFDSRSKPCPKCPERTWRIVIDLRHFDAAPLLDALLLNHHLFAAHLVLFGDLQQEKRL